MAKNRRQKRPPRTSMARGAALYTLLFGVVATFLAFLLILLSDWDTQVKYNACLSAAAFAATIGGLLWCMLATGND